MVLAAGAALAGVWLGSAHADGPLPTVTGPRLRGATHLRLIVGNTPPLVVNVDTERVTTVRGVMGQPRVGGPQVTSVLPVPTGAYVSVWDGRADTGYFVGAKETPTARAAGADLIPDRSSSAVWSLTRAAGGCVLGARAGAAARCVPPCGSLRLDTDAGLLITNPPYAMLVDGSSGKVARAPARARPGRTDQREPTCSRTRVPASRFPASWHSSTSRDGDAAAPALAEHPPDRPEDCCRATRAARRGRIRLRRLPRASAGG